MLWDPGLSPVLTELPLSCVYTQTRTLGGFSAPENLCKLPETLPSFYPFQVCTSLLSSGLYQAQEEKESLPLPLFPFSLPISSSSLPPSIPFSFSSHYLWYPGTFLGSAGLFIKGSTPIRKQARTLNTAGHPRAQLCSQVHSSLALKWLDMQTQVTPELLSSLPGIGENLCLILC